MNAYQTCIALRRTIRCVENQMADESRMAHWALTGGLMDEYRKHTDRANRRMAALKRLRAAHGSRIADALTQCR